MFELGRLLLILLPSVNCIIVHTQEEICGQKVMTSNTGWFTSPYYPLEYLSDQFCEWVIEVEPGNIIEITFNDFEVDDQYEGHGDFGNDYVLVFENGTDDDGVYFQTPLEHNKYRSISNQVVIQFVSDDVDNFKGFNASYESWNVDDFCQKYSLHAKDIRCYDESKHDFYKRCYVTCFDGYILKGSSKVTCHNGKFLPEIPCGLIDFEARLCEITDMAYCIYSPEEIAEYLWKQFSKPGIEDFDDTSILDSFPDPLDLAPEQPTRPPGQDGFVDSSTGIEAACFDKLINYNYCARKKNRKYAFNCQSFLKIKKLGFNAAARKMRTCLQCRSIGCTNVVYI